MQQFIYEAEIDSIDIFQFHQILAVKSEGDFAGVEVRPDRRMAAFVSPEKSAPVTTTNTLFIVVDNPDDPETLMRLKSLVEAELSA